VSRRYLWGKDLKGWRAQVSIAKAFFNHASPHGSSRAQTLLARTRGACAAQTRTHAAHAHDTRTRTLPAHTRCPRSRYPRSHAARAHTLLALTRCPLSHTVRTHTLLRSLAARTLYKVARSEDCTLCCPGHHGGGVGSPPSGVRLVVATHYPRGQRARNPGPVERGRRFAAPGRRGQKNVRDLGRWQQRKMGIAARCPWQRGVRGLCREGRGPVATSADCCCGARCRNSATERVWGLLRYQIQKKISISFVMWSGDRLIPQ
jgi:hypothetical protein